MKLLLSLAIAAMTAFSCGLSQRQQPNFEIKTFPLEKVLAALKRPTSIRTEIPI
jgi:hypothetical protein